MTIICNSCGKPFEVEPSSTEIHAKGVRIVRCPHCGAANTVHM